MTHVIRGPIHLVETAPASIPRGRAETFGWAYLGSTADRARRVTYLWEKPDGAIVRSGVRHLFLPVRRK